MSSIETDRLYVVITNLLEVAESAGSAAREAEAASLDHPSDELGQMAFRTGYLRARLGLVTAAVRTAALELRDIRANLSADGSAEQ